MAVSYSPLAAANASVKFNGTFLPCQRWSVNYRSEDIDATNTEGAGFQEKVASFDLEALGKSRPNSPVRSAEVSIDLLYDPTNFQVFNTLVLKPGYKLTDLYLFPNRQQDDTNFWHFPNATVLSFNMDAEAKGAVRCSLTVKNDGTFTNPA